MHFEHPQLLGVAILALPALIAFFWWSWRARRRLISQFVQSRLLAHLTVGVSARRLKFRMALLVATVVLILVTLARPQWGFHWEEARQRGLDIIVAIDTSRSMLAEDMAPNRLARAKLSAVDLKRLARADRVGLVAFAGSAFLQCPLAFDEEAFRQNVNALDVSIIPQGGTALAESIRCAEAAFKDKNDNHKVLVLFSDGEDHDGEAVEAARSAAKEGMRVFTIGVGTPNGELLRVKDANGRSDYVRDDQGNVVKSRLNEQLLREIAQAGDGFYLLLTGANTMDMLYERGLAPLPKSELSARRVKRYHERYQWLLGLAVSLLMLEMFLPERRRVQRSEAILNAGANAELRKAVALLVLALFPFAVISAPAAALKQYQSGRYAAALRAYEQALQKKPNDPRLRFNAGTAAYQAGKYEKALEHLNSALVTPDVQLQQRAYYNRGDAQFRLGEEEQDPKKRTAAWEEAVSSFESAMKLDPRDTDAKYNLDLVKHKLEELKKQQQQQQNQDDKKDDKKDDQKDDKKDQQKDNQKQQDQSKQDQQQKDQQQQKPDQKDSQSQQEKQQQEKERQQKQEQQKQQDQKAGKQNEKGDKQDQGEAAQSMKPMQMTPRQAQQLLDAQKGEEKAMIFIPQLRTNRQDRVFKDW